MICIGIDPGLDGAIAWLTRDQSGGPSDSWEPMPVVGKSGTRRQYDLSRLQDLLGEPKRYSFGVVHAFVEALQPLPATMGGSSANFGRGRALGLLEAFLVCGGIPYTLVRPRAWMKVMHAGTTGDDTKQKSILAAQRLFPCISLMKTERCKKPHDGGAEALLLAEYGRRLLGKQVSHDTPAVAHTATHSSPELHPS